TRFLTCYLNRPPHAAGSFRPCPGVQASGEPCPLEIRAIGSLFVSLVSLMSVLSADRCWISTDDTRAGCAERVISCRPGTRAHTSAQAWIARAQLARTAREE